MGETGKRNDPFVAFRFDLKFDEESFGGFSECSGLNLETQVQDYPEGGQNDFTHRFPTRTVQTNVILKRGIVDRRVWDWYFQATQGQVKPRTVSVLVYDGSGTEVVMEYQLRRAFPCKWNGPELNATQNNVALETLELCHQGLERRK